MVWRSVRCIRSARIRDIASEGPPAEHGTMMVMGCDGKFCAGAGPPDISNASAAKTVLRITPPATLHRRHCEEQSDEAIQLSLSRRDGLLRYARNDGVSRTTVHSFA